MFCIFAFVLFMILGIFSASYRSLAKKAWGCVWTRLTFRTCDISLQQEIRARFIGKYIVSHPKFAQFLTKWIDTISFVFVALSVWSLLVVVNSGINYYVYDTCSPSDPESCSLSSGACGIGSHKMTFTESLKSGEVVLWVKTETTSYFEKLSRIPDRMKSWDAKEYISKTATYANKFDEKKPTAVEMIDPGCFYCGQMFRSTKEVEFGKKYNFTYLLYPIPNPDKPGEYKFKNSLLLAKFVEASKKFSKINEEPSLDWKILERLYLEKDENGVEYQKQFNEQYSNDEARAQLIKWVKSFGYDTQTVAKIDLYSNSDEVAQSIKDQASIVNDKVRTVKIPTIIFNNRRFDRVVDKETLLK